MRRLLITLILIFLAGSVFLAIKGETQATASGASFRSSELQAVVTTVGDTERTDFYYNGALTFAADKHYASIVKTKSERALLEEYFDAAGEPAEQPDGHCALLREYDEQNRNFKTTYLGADGQPIMNAAGYCFWVRAFNEAGKVEYERYYVADGRPAKRTNGAYGRHNLYENGKNTVIVYLDDRDEPACINAGYAELRRTFCGDGPAAGKVENEFYFDENAEPAALSLGQYGVHYGYDELGRTEIITYLAADGSPIVSNRGYATVKRTFNSDNAVETEMYFDQNGAPAALYAGQYGLKFVGDKTIYLNQNGEEIFDLNHWLRDNHIYVIVFGMVVVLLSMVLGKKGNAVLLVFYLIFILYMTLMYRPDGESRAKLELFWSYRKFFSSPSFRIEILNNIWLFIPLGAILYRLGTISYGPRKSDGFGQKLYGEQSRSDKEQWKSDGFETKSYGEQSESYDQRQLSYGRQTKLFRLWPSICLLIVPVLLSILIEIIQYFTGLGLCELDDVISNSIGAWIGFGIGYLLRPPKRRQ